MAIFSTVMYVDDDAEDRMLFADAVKAIDGEYHLEMASDGLDALSMLKNPGAHLPSLLIVDLNMPGMGGLELIRSLKTDSRLADLPTIVFTTSGSSTDRQECARYGVEMHTKPLTFGELKQSVQKLLAYIKN
ncbi:MAG: response regulator [Niastella sp.]|nr:response regulator [Niastella sp.]